MHLPHLTVFPISGHAKGNQSGRSENDYVHLRHLIVFPISGRAKGNQSGRSENDYVQNWLDMTHVKTLYFALIINL